MSFFVGIDLGTTNSAICSYDGEALRLYKSPEQNDVTPSAIFIDRRGNKYVGVRAYNNAPRNPDNAATLFKRLMGTTTPIKLSAVDKVMTPEECSAEILRTLFGYLPEEMRNSAETGTVITVPAAFNQMQKDSTSAAAEMAGLGKISLMQEPVAAVMAVMQKRRGDGIFVIYDLGGGTLDVAIAQSIGGRVSLLSHGGIAMCGGRDFDRMVLSNIITPWLLDTFDLPEDFATDARFRGLTRMATYAAEKAKIELSGREDAVISLSEVEIASRDVAGTEIYLDVPFNRATFDALIKDKVDESIQAVRETLEKAGLSSHDVERLVFVGGPTHYKPLRDRVAFELGIAASTDVNPMTAVAEGAAVFAESIDWASQRRGRKSARGAVSIGGGLDISFNFVARTPDARAKVAIKVGGKPIPGAEFQLDSLDTGWSSGRVALKDGATVDLPLAKAGDNTFKVFVFDAAGGPLELPNSRIVVARTAATIDAIPASSSIGIEVLDKIGGRPVLEYLVKEGDPLPKKGRKVFKAGESLRAGAANSLRLNIWEGDIEDPVSDNRPVGAMEIRGTDFETGAIAAGADLICDYEMMDSGNIVLEVSVPQIGGVFHSGRNFYSRQAGGIDYSDASKQLTEEATRLRARLDEVVAKLDDERLEKAAERLDEAEAAEHAAGDPEITKEAMDRLLEAKKLLAQVRKDHGAVIRKLDLDNCVEFFDKHVRPHARPTEEQAFDNLARTAQRAVDRKTTEFEGLLDELRGKNFEILWRQDWFVAARFESMAQEPWMFADRQEHAKLVQVGKAALQADDFAKLRAVVGLLYSQRIGAGGDEDLLAPANIVRS
jgi:molecular chaperone DnaK